MLSTINKTKLTSPLIYFGNQNHGGQSQDDIFSLIQERIKKQGKKFTCCYDLFAGSASFSIEAMRLDIAECYVINDLYTPLKIFWETVVHTQNSELLIECYTEIVKAYTKVVSEEKENCYAQVQKKFNQDFSDTVDTSARLAFLINYANNGIPNFSLDIHTGKQLLTCQPSKSPPPDVAPEEFARRVRELNKFLQNKQVVFSDKNFISFKSSITANDFVCLEPPYPNLEDQQEKPQGFVYARQQTKSQLKNDLENYLQHLEKQDTPFFMLYGILGLNNEHPITWPQGHVFRLAGYPNFIFNEYVEHLYLSPNLIRILLSDTKYQGKIQPLLHRIIETQAIHNGKNVALNWQGQTCTYEMLNQQANRLGRFLLEQGLEKDLNEHKEALVTLYLDRSPQYIIGLFAVMKSGAAFLPLDTHPVRLSISAAYERIQKSQSRYVITHPHLAKQLKQEAQKHLAPFMVTFVEMDTDDLWCQQLPTLNSSDIPFQKQEIQTQSVFAADNLNRFIKPDNLAYVMYTSGSTGEPKGVEILHRGLPYAVLSHQDLLNLNPKENISQFASPGFDASLMEIFMTLACGAQLHLVDEITFTDTEKLREFYQTHEITVAIQTPKKLEGFNPQELPHLRAVLIVGDKFTKEFALSWRDRGSTIEKRFVVNGFGLTETTICSTLELCEEGKIFSIGKPILGLQAKLIPLNKEAKTLFLEHSSETNPDECMELYLSGPCVARGYWQQPHLTTSRFQYDLQADTHWYKTGDVVKVLSDGRLIYMGRCDRQIKLRGQRLELDEIETRLRSCDGVKNVRVVPFIDEKTGKAKSLAAYVEVQKNFTDHGQIPSEASLIFIQTLRQQLKQNMPGFMCPALTNFLLVKNLPRKSNDKESFDDKTMKQDWPLPCLKLPAIANVVLPTSEDQNTLAQVKEILLHVLGLQHPDAITDESDFYDLSGDSLLVNLFLSRLKQAKFPRSEFSRLIQELNVSDFNQEPTLKGLWQWFEKKQFQEREQKENFEAKLVSLPMSEELFAKDTSLVEGQFHLKIAMPFFTLPSLLGNPLLDYHNSVLQNLPCDLNYLHPLTLSDTQAEEVSKRPQEYLAHLLNQYQLDLQKMENKGPYWLLGWSTGGWVALALARCLRQQGHRSFVFMLDTQHPCLFQNLNQSSWLTQLLKLAKKIVKGVSVVLQIQGLALNLHELEALKKELENAREQTTQITFLFQWLRTYFKNHEKLHQNSALEKLTAMQQLINHAQTLFSLEYHLSLANAQSLLDPTLDDDTLLITAGKSEQLWGKQLGWKINPIHHHLISNTSHFKLISQSQELVTILKCYLAQQLTFIKLPYFRGVEALFNKEFTKAVELFNQALKENPRNEKAYHNRGNAKADLGQLEMAIKDYDESINLDSNSTKTYFNRGITKAELGQHKAAIDDYDMAITLDPYDYQKYVNRGNAKADLGQLEMAIQDYDKAIELNPKSKTAYFNRGIAKAELGQHKAAIDDYDMAIILDPYDYEKYIGRGNVKADLGQLEMAIQDYDKAIELNPENKTAYFNRGITKSDLGQLEMAIQDYDKVIELNPKSYRAYVNRSDAKTKLGLYESAIEDCDQVLLLQPNDEIGHFNRGEARFYLGQHQAAVQDFTKTLSLNPDEDDAYIYRGRANTKLGHYDSAIQDFKFALIIKPDNRKAYYYLGKCYIALSQKAEKTQSLEYALFCYKEALSSFEGALKIDSQDKKTQQAKNSILQSMQTLEKNLKPSSNILSTDSALQKSNYDQHGLFGFAQQTEQTNKNKEESSQNFACAFNNPKQKF